MNSSSIRGGAPCSETAISVEGHCENDSEPPESAMQILIANQQSVLVIDSDRMRVVVRNILKNAHIASATLSIAIVDDRSIHQLNQRYLRHDWPTDVLSFPLEKCAGHLEGEVVVSADTAARVAAEIPWPGTEELLLYVIHGTLHLVGYRDKHPEEAAKMRAAEMVYLHQAGVEVVAGDERWQTGQCKNVTKGDNETMGGLPSS